MSWKSTPPPGLKARQLSGMVRHFGLGGPDMPKPKVMIKFKASIPINLRTALVDFGFQLYSAKHGDWVIFAKDEITQKKPPELRDTLGPPWEKELERKMTKNIDVYLDPYSNLGAIKAQIIHMSRTLPKEQEKWCMEWMDKNLDGEFFTPPWEDPNYEPNLGTC